MKKFYLTIVFGLLSLSSYCQVYRVYSPEYANLDLCINNYVRYSDNINANFIVNNILVKTGLTQNTFFITKICKGLNNAVALNYNGAKYILIDSDWVESLKYGSEDWFHLFVIAHEMAHHILGHTDNIEVDNTTRRVHELEADEFAGSILALYGASEIIINDLLNNFPENNEINSTHPTKVARVNAIKSGYSKSIYDNSPILLENLTKDSDFQLEGIHQLVNSARTNFYYFLNTNNVKYLDIAIDFYKQSIRFFDDAVLVYELGAAFLAYGNFDSYVESLTVAYNKTNNPEYIYELVNSCISYNYSNTESVLLKYGTIITNYSTVMSDLQSITLLKYYYYNSIQNPSFLSKNMENQILLYDKVMHSFNINDSSFNNFLFQFEIYNLYASFSILTNDFSRAETSLTSCNSLLNYLSTFKMYETAFSNYSLNYLVYCYNSILTSIRLNKWQVALDYIRLYDDYIDSLDVLKDSFVLNLINSQKNDITYFEGRCYQGLNMFDDAINEYSKIIQQDSVGYVYYFRGICYFAMKDNLNSSNDLKHSCNLGYSEACSRYLILFDD